MRNISISQFIVVIFLGILLFSDFSKMTQSFHALIKKNSIYKNIKKK
uniref:Twin arginine protein translocation system-TatA protein n=1 Tax=Thalassiosira rotula TaxID=49265 RepID=A0A8B0SBY6_9STRA|nr:twin arginine protein translocation system-TatA protein [Thalassiosira rotula]QTX08906.1 twin arginine protein translocation system-TatA protein [Thalassiosira rotula]